MQEQYTYKTISSVSTADFRDRGSKFLAYAYPVTTVEQTKEYIKALKKEHPKAVHFCSAFRIGTDGLLYRANDDGEPSGSAGKPILGQIDSRGVTDTLIVVVRYFGGTQLGIFSVYNDSPICLMTSISSESFQYTRFSSAVSFFRKLKTMVFCVRS